MQQIVTKAELAEQLRVSRPRITQYLKQGLPVREDGRIDLREALNWIVCNVEPAMEGGGAAERASELLAGTPQTEIERAAADVEVALRRLRAAPGVEAARALVNNGLGAAIGRLDRELQQGAAHCAAHERGLLDIARHQIVGSAVGELMQICNWQVAA